MIKQNNTLTFLGNCHVITHFGSPGRHKTGFLSLIPRNTVKVTLVNFIEESTSISVESTFQTLITEIDVRLYQYSCVDFIKWQEKAKILVQA